MKHVLECFNMCRNITFVNVVTIDDLFIQFGILWHIAALKVLVRKEGLGTAV